MPYLPRGGPKKAAPNPSENNPYQKKYPRFILSRVPDDAATLTQGVYLLIQSFLLRMMITVLSKNLYLDFSDVTKRTAARLRHLRLKKKLALPIIRSKMYKQSYLASSLSAKKGWKTRRARVADLIEEKQPATLPAFSLMELGTTDARAAKRASLRSMTPALLPFSSKKEKSSKNDKRALESEDDVGTEEVGFDGQSNESFDVKKSKTPCQVKKSKKPDVMEKRKKADEVEKPDVVKKSKVGPDEAVESKVGADEAVESKEEPVTKQVSCGGGSTEGILKNDDGNAYISRLADIIKDSLDIEVCHMTADLIQEANTNGTFITFIVGVEALF
jgi:hypothetical protein